ncbi:INO80 chromatin remodeling complex association protein [Komagataella phaffii CBS 7435]|uniref:Protein that associates with the INO80 chromatin remodeling complex under low-salt conditions n=2 Tax=Komagataella phaffii TaxID=460519 RepID=C4R7P0_KOMPG|nr:uncharacterized protein PAS_chr4_0370 [Komagataella phaffii GS115]AOA64555.1 GQ67_04715T0 [Komagataella phaffii]CAH2451004.1 INO80 chromatin remodeling complex association protein [Komagataella phaffii CBS 7435]AOA69852.1 GQ68_04687T0 [Komagataella phaffii GS115]CAY71615.1 Protein that associates with the INO80 chromatin remodeling complex under low-salt conditions [Komagataella phaffii GS115]CCA40782.1 INO80 chromatin remodeling complex association protein [Komagataella phaffii CBS 7435]
MSQEELDRVSDMLVGPLPFKNPNWHRKKKYKPARQLINDEQKRINSKENRTFDEVNYFTVQAPPSLKPRKTYCDITGLPTSYRAPHSQIRFYNMEVYEVVKNMASGVDQQYLGLRGANVVLR